MKPENVNPQNFEVEKIIYNQYEFSIAVGIWQEDESRRFAMRWNVGENDDTGFPKVFGHPMWFQLPINVNGIVSALIENWNKGEAIL